MADELELSGTETELDLGETTEAEVEAGDAGDAGQAAPAGDAGDAGQAARSTGDDWKTLKEVLKDHPDLHKRVKGALHAAANLEKRFPDGVAAVENRLKLLSQLDDNPDDPDYVAGSTPIEDVISNTIAERGFWRSFDTAFQAGDPAIVNQMVEANGEAFQKLIPLAMDRFSEMNPDGFSSYVCRSVAPFLEAQQIPLHLALLARVLPEKSDDPGLQTVIEAVKAIRGTVEQIQSTAKKPIEPAKGSAAAKTEESGQQSLESRELAVTHDEWLREVRPRSEKAMVDEVQRAYPGKRFTPQEVSLIRKALTEEVNARTRINSGYQTRIRGFLKAKNRAAYLMTAEGEHKKIIRDAVKRAVDPVLAKRVKGKTNAQQQPGNQQRQQEAAQTATNGNFRRIAKSPSQLGLAVDWSRTDNEMYAKETAYIKGEKQAVKWGKA
jgi:hypothetical protein